MAVTGLWKWKVKLTVDHTKVSSDQTDFPVPLCWSGAAGSSNIPSDPLITGGAKAAKSDGSDVRFTTDVNGQNEIPFEIVQWTQNAAAASARAELYVKIASLSSSVDNVIYMWWGNTAASAYAVGDTYGRNNVWTNNYIWVSHCNENAGSTQVDSTGAKSATYKAGMPARQATGPMQSSQRFSSAANKWSRMTSYAALGFNGGVQDKTLSCVMVRNSSGVYQGIYQKDDSNSSSTPGGLRWQWCASQNGTGEFQHWRGLLGGGGVDSSDTVGTTSAVNFQHLAYTYNHVNGKNYIDASEETILTNAGNLPDDTYDSLTIGNWNGFPGPGGDQLQADVDELRISKVARTQGWITTDKNSFMSPNTFLSPGSVVDAFPKASFFPFLFQSAGVHA